MNLARGLSLRFEVGDEVGLKGVKKMSSELLLKTKEQDCKRWCDSTVMPFIVMSKSTAFFPIFSVLYIIFKNLLML